MRIHPTNRSCRVRPHVAATGYDCTQQATPRPSRHKNFFAPVQHSRSPVHLTEKQRHETLHLRAPFRHLLHCGLCLYPPIPPLPTARPARLRLCSGRDALRRNRPPRRRHPPLRHDTGAAGRTAASPKRPEGTRQIRPDNPRPESATDGLRCISDDIRKGNGRDTDPRFDLRLRHRAERTGQKVTPANNGTTSAEEVFARPRHLPRRSRIPPHPEKGLLSHKASGTTAPYAFRRHIPTGQSQPLPVSSVDTLLLLPPRSSRRRTALLRFHRGRSRHRIPLPRQTGNSRRVERDALLLHPRPGTARHCMEQPPRGVFRHDGRHLGLPSSSPVHIRLRSQLHPLSLGLPLRHTGRGRNAAGTAGTRKASATITGRRAFRSPDTSTSHPEFFSAYRTSPPSCGSAIPNRGDTNIRLPSN